MNIYRQEDIKLIAPLLRKGKILAFPTETVFGLGVVYDKELSFKRLCKVKNRLPNKPFTLMCGSKDDIKKYAEVSPEIQRVIDKYMPGPLTLILKAKKDLPSWVSLGTGFVGVRVSGSKFVSDMIIEVGKPLLVPSANLANEDPALNIDEVLQTFGKTIDGVISGEVSDGVPSSVIDLSKETPILLRKGIINIEEVEKTMKGR